MHSPYHLIPIVVLTFILYFFSYLLVKIGFWGKAVHRKIWNTLLLLTFIVTAILGLLLAIQINFKLDWSFVKKMLKWHVNFGIAMGITAIFHLTWHWSYYLKLFKAQPGNSVMKSDLASDTVNKNLPLLIILSGFIATVVQVLFIREIATVFEGNELMMCWTLGTWMFLTGSGAFLGRGIKSRHNNSRIANVIFVLGLLPVVIVPLMVLLKHILFPPGVLVSPIYFILIIILLLGPVCILSGWVFALLVHSYQRTENDFMKVYAFEAIGSLIGGLCVSFILIHWFSIPESVLILAFAVLILLYYMDGRVHYLITGLLCLLILISCFIFPVGNYLKSFLYINQKVVASVETYYGNIAVTENAGQYNFYGNGSLLFTSENTIVSEEYVHYALLQLRDPQDILLVSGGVSGMVKEILKYPDIRSLTYIEQNPAIFRLADKFAPLPRDIRIHKVKGDIRRYVTRTGSKYDAAIMALPDPSSLQVDRLYTTNFIHILKQHLNPGGVMIYGIAPAINYLSEVQKKLEASLYNTLRHEFNNVRIIPGERDYYIASDSTLSVAISQLCSRQAFENTYVNPYYIDDNSIKERSNYIIQGISDQKIINTDDKPLPVFLSSLHFLAQFGSHWWLWLLLPVVFLILPVIRMRSMTGTIYLTGFTAASVEILIIFSLQVVFGYVYAALGMIIAVFMCGLAIGAISGRTLPIRLRYLLSAQTFLLLYVLFFPIAWLIINKTSSGILLLICFSTLTLIPSILTGFIYVAATKITSGNIMINAPVNYAVDLLGSALGVLVFSILVLPLAGIKTGCFILAGINLVGIILNLMYTADYAK
jgi:spermidine synthase